MNGDWRAARSAGGREDVRPALLTVDLQLSLLKGAFPRSVREALLKRLELYRAEGLPIIHAVGGHGVLRARRAGDALDPGLLPRPEGPLYGGFLAQGYIQRLGPNEVILHKPLWGAFGRTRLEAYLRGLGVGSILMAGLAFPCGPRSTLFEGRQRRYGVVLLEEAITGMHPLAKMEAARLGAGLLGSASARRGFPMRRSRPGIAA